MILLLLLILLLHIVFAFLFYAHAVLTVRQKTAENVDTVFLSIGTLSFSLLTGSMFQSYSVIRNFLDGCST